MPTNSRISQAAEPSPFLRVWLDEFAPVAAGVNTEKARSEFIIMPILAEARRRARPVNVLPGSAWRWTACGGWTVLRLRHRAWPSAEYFFLTA